MAYPKVNNTSGTNKKDIKYLNRNYNQLKQDLVDFTKNYFPDNFNDFSESKILKSSTSNSNLYQPALS